MNMNMKHWKNTEGKTKVFWAKHVPVQFRQQKIPPFTGN